MPNVTNTSKVNNFQYNVSPGQGANGSSNTSAVTVNVTAASVTFTKTNNPEYIDLGGSSTITYTITNNNPEKLTVATITDPIFTTAGVTFSNLQGATLSGNTLTVDLPSGGLTQNSTDTVSVKVTVANTAVPSNTTYDTTAIGTFTIATTPASIITQSAKGHLVVNSAILLVTKTVSPSVTTITQGNLLTYTITITNTGNVSATIPTGQFVDSWTSNGLTNVQTNTPGFTVSGSDIKNSSPITIAAGTTVTLVFTGNANVPN